MKITFEIPDNTKCVTLSLVCATPWDIAMAVKAYAVPELKDGAVLDTPNVWNLKPTLPEYDE